MTITFDEDLILPITTAIVTILFVIGYQTLAPKSDADYWISENDILFSEVSAANREIDTLTKEVQSYRATAESLESLGASHAQAIQVIKASETYGLDAKH